MKDFNPNFLREASNQRNIAMTVPTPTPRGTLAALRLDQSILAAQFENTAKREGGEWSVVWQRAKNRVVALDEALAALDAQERLTAVETRLRAILDVESGDGVGPLELTDVIEAELNTAHEQQQQAEQRALTLEDHLKAALHNASLVMTECAPYLHPEETPAECIARHRKDIDATLTLLRQEKQRAATAETDTIARLKADLANDDDARNDRARRLLGLTTDHPAVIAVMGSDPACQANGCQARILRQELDECQRLRAQEAERELTALRAQHAALVEEHRQLNNYLQERTNELSRRAEIAEAEVARLQDGGKA